MILISRNKQIVFYILIIIFGTIFFVYFYQQAIVSDSSGTTVNVGSQAVKRSPNLNIKIDVNLFQSDKFKSLRSDSMPAATFDSGKRNPFEPLK